MKKGLFFILFGVSRLTDAQQFDPTMVDCGGAFSGSSGNYPSTQGVTCTSNSAAWNSKYKLQSFYVPTTNDPVITLKITFHVFNDANGNGSFPNTPQGINDLTTLAGYIHDWSERYGVARSASYNPTGFNSPFIPDARINFELTNIYFYNDNTLNTYVNTAGDPSIWNYINGIDPNRQNEGLAVIFNNGVMGAAAGYQSSNAGLPYVHTFIVSPPMNLWWCQEHLRHEIGHALGLGHTYQYNGDEVATFGHPCTNYDFLSDVFPTNNGCTTNLGCGACWENVGGLTSNNLMSGQIGNLWMSPLQMGRRIKYMHLNSVRKYAKEMTSGTLNPWLITSNETWDFDIQMYQDIIVKSGATLTIQCKVAMPNNGRIIVERGAKLIVDGGEISTWCSEWAGIQVWGTSTKRQVVTAGLSVDHGIVQVVNQGTIKDAEIAIATMKYDDQGNIDWGGYFGGIIQCDGANFINNRKAIGYMSYHNFNLQGSTIDNIGYVRRSTFETNAPLKSGQYPENFISLWDVHGVKFYGNIYQNTRNPLPAIASRGDGIYSVDASYYVDRYKVCYASNGNTCIYIPNVQSTFQNLHYGVHVQNATPLTNIRINDNDFIGCNRSVYIGGTYNTTITNNRINVGDGVNNLNSLPYGIYAENSSAYDISNNTIWSTQWTNYNLSIGTGICINGTNGLNNLLYRNTINMMGGGVTVYGDNQGTNPGDGLKLKCNTFGQGVNGKNYIDIDMGLQQFTNGKIDHYQGSSSFGANNFFSHTNNTSPNIKSDYSDNHFTGANYGTPGSIQYFYNPTGGQLTQPFYYDNGMAINQISINYNGGSMCPQTFSGGGSGGSGGGSVAGGKQIIVTNTNKINALLAKIDGNNTQLLLSKINSSIDAGQLKNDLLAVGPYLSDPVLSAYLLRKQGNPDGHVLQIVTSNSPLSYDVKQVVDGLNLSNGVRNQINAAQTGISARTVLYGQVADLNQERGWAVDATIRNLMSDTINGWNKDSILELMKFDNRHEAVCRLLAGYVALKRYTDASNLVSYMQTQGPLDDFCRLQALLIQLEQSQRGIYAIEQDASSKQIIEQIEAAKTDEGYSNAQAILSRVFNYKYYEYISLPQIGSSSQRLLKADDETGQIQDVSKQFVVFPNPSNSNIFVTFITQEKFSVAEVCIYDVTGKLVLKQQLKPEDHVHSLVAENLSPGMYLVNLVLDGKVTDKQKFIRE